MPVNSKLKYRGINQSGAEFNPNNLPGKPGYDYMVLNNNVNIISYGLPNTFKASLYIPIIFTISTQNL